MINAIMQDIAILLDRWLWRLMTRPYRVSITGSGSIFILPQFLLALTWFTGVERAFTPLGDGFSTVPHQNASWCYCSTVV